MFGLHSVISALPFGLIMLVLCYCLTKALYSDHVFHTAEFHYGRSSWDGKHWREQLGKYTTNILYIYFRNISNFAANIYSSYQQ